MRESSYDARGGPVLFPSPPLLLLDTYAGDSLRTRAPLSSSNLVARPVLAAGRGRRGNKIHRASFSWSRSPFRARWSPPCVYICMRRSLCVSRGPSLFLVVLGRVRPCDFFGAHLGGVRVLYERVDMWRMEEYIFRGLFMRIEISKLGRFFSGKGQWSHGTVGV